ncbi:CBS domain-containing protein [Leptospira sp. 96542]|nr:CBS domain-containing protein [Leptospira sp. 96542]
MFFWIQDGRILPTPPALAQNPRVASVPKADGPKRTNDSLTSGFQKTGSALFRRDPKKAYEESENTEVSVHFVHQIMASPAKTLPATQNINQCFEFMLENRIRHLPLTDPSGILKGFVSDRDLLLQKSKSMGNEEVSEIMKKQVLVASPTAEIRQVTKILLEERIGSLPIVNDEMKPIGILTRSDLLRLIVKFPNLNLFV